MYFYQWEQSINSSNIRRRKEKLKKQFKKALLLANGAHFIVHPLLSQCTLLHFLFSRSRRFRKSRADVCTRIIQSVTLEHETGSKSYNITFQSITKGVCVYTRKHVRSCILDIVMVDGWEYLQEYASYKIRNRN